jgi:hypothetical protein
MDGGAARGGPFASAPLASAAKAAMAQAIKVRPRATQVMVRVLIIVIDSG